MARRADVRPRPLRSGGLPVSTLHGDLADSSAQRRAPACCRPPPVRARRCRPRPTADASSPASSGGVPSHRDAESACRVAAARASAARDGTTRLGGGGDPSRSTTRSTGFPKPRRSCWLAWLATPDGFLMCRQGQSLSHTPEALLTLNRKTPVSRISAASAHSRDGVPPSLVIRPRDVRLLARAPASRRAFTTRPGSGITGARRPRCSTVPSTARAVDYHGSYSTAALARWASQLAEHIHDGRRGVHLLQQQS